MGEPSVERQRIFEELLAQARSGSREAFQELVDPFERILRYRARRRLGRRLRGKISDSDVRQLTYLQSFENLSQFQGNTFDEFGCWLLGIMDHVCQKEQRNYHRQAREISREVPLDQVENKLVTGDQPAIEDKRNRPFEAAWRELPYQYRQVLDWRYHEKCSHEEIGNRLGVSPDAAKHLYRRAMRKLSDDAHKHEKE